MASNTEQPRPAIVAVLGHVDHGKTSLLDRIRNTSVASREAGGITQSIGAWQAKAKDGKLITFIDTPGHAAFNAMRSRGATASDIAILVVAADDGVMPQTKESLEYLREAQTPFVVAITKSDLQTANPEVVKTQLAQEGVYLEGRGGDVVAIEVSSTTGKGIDELLDMLSLLSEMNEVKADPEADPEVIVIETELDKRRGPVVSGIVRNGILKVGLDIGTEGNNARVRGLFDQTTAPIKEAAPGTPVQILGFATLPPVGALLTKPGAASQPQNEASQARNLPRKKEGFWIILNADTAGSLEAIMGQLGTNVGILSSNVGEINENDITIASAAQVPVVGFNIKVSKEVQKMAEEEGVKVYTYRIIYELLQDVERWRKELEEAGRDKILGRAQIIAQFPHGKSRIAGCKLLEGRIAKPDRLRLIREDKSIGNVRLSSLKKAKEEVDKVEQGEEFGAYFEPQLDFRLGDILEAFVPAKA